MTSLNISTTAVQTDATMAELEIEANMKFSEWSIIQEAGQQLVPCYGPGYTGLVNLGNSCYLNSVVQVLFSLKEFKQRSERGRGCFFIDIGHLCQHIYPNNVITCFHKIK